MKYINEYTGRKYSTVSTENSKFKKGDIVYCINTDNTSLQENKPYIIDDVTAEVRKEDDVSKIFYFYLIKDLYQGEFNEKRFVSELEYYANKYNI